MASVTQLKFKQTVYMRLKHDRLYRFTGLIQCPQLSFRVRNSLIEFVTLFSLINLAAVAQTLRYNEALEQLFIIPEAVRGMRRYEFN